MTQLAVVLVVVLAQQAENPDLKGKILNESGTPVPTGVQDRTGAAPKPYSSELDEEQKAWVEQTLAGLSVREMAGQMMMAWVPGSYDSTDSDDFDRSLEQVEAGAGALWVMGGLPYDRAAKINVLQERSKLPLLVTGGVRGTDLPPLMAYAAVGDPSEVRELGRIRGLEARATGTNMMGDSGGANLLKNLANVLGNGTFGDDAQHTARLMEAFIEGAHEAGATTCPGFFPGAGSMAGDPHVTLPVNWTERAEFEEELFLPFKSVIRAGTACIMTSHFAAPELTGSETLPATLSPEVTRILREELGFEGLLLTDSMAMGGITNTYEPIEAAVLAVKAGNDLLMGTYTDRAADKIAEFVESGEIPIDQLRTSVRRILVAKARLRLHERRLVDLDAIITVVGTREHQHAADSVADRSIVLLRDEKELVPFSSGLRVLSVTFERRDNQEAGGGFNSLLRQGVAWLDTERVSPETGPSLFDDLLRRAEKADRIVLSVYIRPRLGVDQYAEMSDDFLKFVHDLQEARSDVVVISFGKLTLLDDLPETGTFMMAWSEWHVMQRAAARALLGSIPISGTLPLNLPPFHKRGDGLTRDGR